METKRQDKGSFTCIWRRKDKTKVAFIYIWRRKRKTKVASLVYGDEKDMTIMNIVPS